MKTRKGLVWIREDLRIKDNASISFATTNHEIVSVLYIYNKKLFDGKREAQKWWLYKSLENFKYELLKFNINLEVLIGDETEILKKITKEKDFTIYWNKVYEPEQIKIEKEIIKHFRKENIGFSFFKGNILIEYQDVTKEDGTPFKVFTPFWKNAEEKYMNKIPSKEGNAKKLKKTEVFFKNNIAIKKILPEKNWYKKFENYWLPSESEALETTKEFIKKKILEYGNTRDFPSIEGTSKISPYLKHGQISVETIWRLCSEIKNKGKGYRKFINEIGWREFSHSLINNFPEMLKGNLRKEFDYFPWIKNDKFLSSWKKGITGYPIVDAGMRELYETGWMHNRVRMIVASFLVKHLRIHWKEGEKYFRNCLVDFNEANNVAQWQWVAGSGADASPYFRIFNPILQGEKFDKEGFYTKKWIPELKNFPEKYLHRPWELDSKTQEKIKIIIGKDYPLPIVEHTMARNKALNAFQSLKKINRQ
ncbi:MAG: deoxyribodipyrimidine photolyase [Candidatus Pelagibacter sp.]|nr:deoxyribodipyrimidine photolyase [Candidatus Pelagibacter sp.]